MTTETITTIRDAIESLELDRIRIRTASGDAILAYSDSTKVYWDDGNERLYWFRVPAGTQPKDPRSMILSVIDYDMIEDITVPGMGEEILELASNLGLSLTEELTTWIKKESSQAGLYPVQNKPPKDKDGKVVTHSTFIPSAK